MQTLNTFERHLINRFQGGVELSQRPFHQMARALDADEDEVLETIERLLNEGWLSRFGPLYNAERLGGSLVLAAMSVPETRFDTVVEQVNALPEVAHNYRRDHWLNMWFVLATDTADSMDLVIRQIETETGLQVFAFPKEQEFYLGLWFEMGDDGSFNTRSIPAVESASPQPLDDLDRRIIAETQKGLPLTHDPCETVADQVGCWPSEVVRRMENMLENGIIRRMGLVPNHYRLGFKGNGMTVWNIPDDQLEEAGHQLGAMDFVSHCYARPRHLPDWPYNLFAMVHGRDRTDVMEKVAELSHQLRRYNQGHEVLFSSAVLKKTGMRLAI
ncbi:MAG: Lrp/AsnC family transcriptional regulator [Candidatus Thiodiazotropha sp. (ex Myrtea spinifera)]|nr:Lrp/AsnC family transcriptional regulator [Candidatus Thiodiazotropha sp. (ex Myrtea spinifera)]MCU7830853.1 Lrp/AsnC family transcriptional regulator [Candidatus Thiodiazotropha sp. (ex Myrtea sp. 'scaly one' KF741663)]